MCVEVKQTNKQFQKEFKSAYHLVVSNHNELLEHKLVRGDSKKRERRIIVTFPLETIGRLTIALLCEKFIGLDQCIDVPDIEEAVGKKCQCEESIDLEELDALFDLSEEAEKSDNSKVKSISKDGLKPLMIKASELNNQEVLSENSNAEYKTVDPIRKLSIEAAASTVKADSLSIEEYAKILGID